MLRSMLLDGFRSFEGNVGVSFAPLTILAGANNVGKSSVIQVLLAFIQSEQTHSGGSLLLDGSWCELGGFEQVLNARRSSEQRLFSIGISGETEAGHSLDTLWHFGPPPEASLASAPILGIEYTSGSIRPADDRFFAWEGELPAPSGDAPTRSRAIAMLVHPGAVLPFILDQKPGELRGEIVISAISAINAQRTSHVGPFRAPPQRLYKPKASPSGPPLGRYGEYTAEHLFRNRGLMVDTSVPGQEAGRDRQPILPAINAWWSYIFDGGLALQINEPDRLGYTLAVDTPSGERLGLGQVGLGLSQTLPIVAACLTSNPGDLLLFETPEAHLHPGAQHRLTNLFVELARRGRQVVVETHSEHLLHAAYLAVKAGLLPPEDVAISFFELQEGHTTVQRIDVDPHGRALRAPRGFFDQAAIDLAELLR